MKSKSRAAWAAAALAVTAALLAPMLAQTAPTAAPSAASGDLPALPAMPAPMDLSKVTPEQAKSYLTTFGWVVAQQIGEKHFGLTNDDIDSLAAGMKIALTTGENPTDIPGGMDGYNLAKEYFQARAEKVHDDQLAKQTEAGNKMFADLDKNPNVKKTPSGLYYEIIKPGTDPKPKTTDVVTVKYTGTYTDGTVFDKTDDKDPTHATLDIPLAEVIPGWAEGLQLIGKGGEIKLYIPAKLAYPDGPNNPLLPGASLVFDTQLLDFKAAPPPDTSTGGLDPALLKQLQQSMGGGAGAAPAATK